MSPQRVLSLLMLPALCGAAIAQSPHPRGGHPGTAAPHSGQTHPGQAHAGQGPHHGLTPEEHMWHQWMYEQMMLDEIMAPRRARRPNSSTQPGMNRQPSDLEQSHPARKRTPGREQRKSEINTAWAT